MLRIALGLILLALVAAFFGFGGIAGLAAAGAELFFFGFLVVVVLGFLFSLVRGI